MAMIPIQTPIAPMPAVLAVTLVVSVILVPSFNPNLEKKDTTGVGKDDREVIFIANQKEDKVDVMIVNARSLNRPIPSNIDSFTTVTLVIGNNKVEIKAGIVINDADATVFPISIPTFFDNPAILGHTILVSDSVNISRTPHKSANLLNFDLRL